MKIRTAREEVERVEGKLLVVDERYIEGDIERASYLRLKQKYGASLRAARERAGAWCSGATSSEVHRPEGSEARGTGCTTTRKPTR